MGGNIQFAYYQRDTKPFLLHISRPHQYSPIPLVSMYFLQHLSNHRLENDWMMVNFQQQHRPALDLNDPDGLLLRVVHLTH